MKFDLKVAYKQEQKLTITEQMKMSINILQMSSYDLRQYIEKEYEENPMIECEFEEKNIEYTDSSGEYRENFEWDIYKEHSRQNDENNLIVWKDKTLKEFLYEQLVVIKLKNSVYRAAKYIIESLDERGYLVEDVRSIAKELGVELNEVNKALQIIQSFEPRGIGCRDIKECLKLQVKEISFKEEKYKKLIGIIIDKYLEDIALGKLRKIANGLNISVEEVIKCCDILKHLEPKPARGFYTGDAVKYIVPDAEIKKEGSNYVVIMSDSIIPKITVKTNLIVNYPKDDEKIESYIKENTVRASFLVKSIEERKKTLLKILQKLIVMQKEFFDGGRKYLKPLTIKEIAHEINMHESTVSRAIKDKYIKTSYGTIKIKDLFSATKFKGGTENVLVGEIYIKELIKNIIEGEDKRRPFSDQVISEKLKENTLNISRRTVAKYREDIGIESSVKRKGK